MRAQCTVGEELGSDGEGGVGCAGTARTLGRRGEGSVTKTAAAADTFAGAELGESCVACLPDGCRARGASGRSRSARVQSSERLSGDSLGGATAADDSRLGEGKLEAVRRANVVERLPVESGRERSVSKMRIDCPRAA